MKRVGPTAKKILLLLSAGVALGLSSSPSRYARVLKAVGKEWRTIERENLYRSIRKLYESKLIDYKENPDGSISVVLSREGHNVSLRYKIDEMDIPQPRQWDRKWRIILFDIPETQKGLRDALRMRLKQLGLMELQKSVFVHPYECRNEIDFIIEMYNARSFVRFVEALHIDNELHFEKKFHLI